MIDEPEVSLHPELLDLLLQLMRESSADTQIITATHSDRFVRFLQPEEVYIADIDEEGETTITRADSLNLEEWMRDYSLDEGKTEKAFKSKLLEFLRPRVQEMPRIDFRVYDGRISKAIS